MRAMVLDNPGPVDRAPLHGETLGDVEPAAGELLLRVACCGVCRTDLQLCEGDLELHARPIVPGHQIVGHVLRAGEGVTRFRVGDRVGVGWLAGACGRCARCLEGRENLCASATFTGWDRHGGYATHAIVREHVAFAIPERFGDLEAAPLLCGGVIGYRSLRRSGIRAGQRLGLFGFGASALLTIQVAVHWGCRVFVCTRSEAEQARARSLGAEWAGGYGEGPPEPLDAAVTFAPAGEVVIAALRALDRGGTVAVNAIHLDRIPEFSYEKLWWERALVSVANYTRRDAEEFLALAAEIPVRTVTETHPLQNANIALRRLRRGETEGAAVLVPT
ncbi:MAG TPA: zinc-dependent alcohol dehydrogenase family protein [Polyangiaceae bacterium]|nr:zinc-dependent alcohol dehydrogenase family protein [Polyangiaceae bacterium]